MALGLTLLTGSDLELIEIRGMPMKSINFGLAIICAFMCCKLKSIQKVGFVISPDSGEPRISSSGGATLFFSQRKFF